MASPFIFYTFFFRKIILTILENPKPLSFCIKFPLFKFIYVLVPEILQSTHKLFQNYILAPIILHLGTCITFYN
jgi:hypothetical protein